jgi:hypothetical protein
MSFNITEKESLVGIEDEGIDVEIDDENGEPAYQADGTTPITIRVVGSLSKRYRKAQENQRQDAIKSIGKKLTGRESLAKQTEFVAACTLGWSAGFTHVVNGAVVDFPFTRENAIDLYTRLPFIQAKLEAAMVDHAGFSRKPSPSSATP